MKNAPRADKKFEWDLKVSDPRRPLKEANPWVNCFMSLFERQVGPMSDKLPYP